MANRREEIIKAKASATAPTHEVMQRLYDAMLAVPEFALTDGTKARVEAYYAPEPDDEGEFNCGIDVVLDNGTQLEFTVRNTGWGKSFVADLAPKGAKEPPSR